MELRDFATILFNGCLAIPSWIRTRDGLATPEKGANTPFSEHTHRSEGSVSRSEQRVN